MENRTEKNERTETTVVSCLKYLHLNTKIMALGAEEAAMLVVVDNLESDLKALEKHLAPFFALSQENINEFDQAKLNIAMAYGINTLFYSNQVIYFTDASVLKNSRN